MDIVIVGAGLTGAITSRCLAASGLVRSVKLLEKNATAGGRARTVHGVEVGLQYVTRQPDPTGASRFLHEALHAELQEEGLLQSIPPSQILGVPPQFADRHTTGSHLVCHAGMQSVVAYLTSNPKISVTTNTTATTMDAHYVTHINAAGETTRSPYDFVVLTVPIPHMKELGGLFAPLYEKLAKRAAYSSRYVWSADVALEEGSWGAKHTASYFPEGAIRYICIDSKKRRYDVGEGVRVMVHTSVPFAEAVVAKGLSPEEVTATLSDEVVQKLRCTLLTPPHLLYLDVSQAIPPQCDTTGVSFVADSSAPLLATGDAFAMTPNFDGCIDAGQKAAAHILSSASSKM